MSNFNLNLATYVTSMFPSFRNSSNFWWWSVAECTQAVPAYHHLTCFHTIAPHDSFGGHSLRVWWYDRWYIPAFGFHYFCFAWLVASFLGFCTEVSENDWLCSYSTISYGSCIWVSVRKFPSAEIMLGIPLWSIVVVCDVANVTQ